MTWDRQTNELIKQNNALQEELKSALDKAKYVNSMKDENIRFREVLQRIQHGCFNFKLMAIKEMVDEALNPKPEFEPIEIKTWRAQWHNGSLQYFEQDPELGRKDCDVTVMTGIINREIAPKVRRREEIEFNMDFIEALVCEGKRIPLSAKYYAEWAE